MRIKKCEFTENLLSLTYRWLNDTEIKELTNTPDFTQIDQKEWFVKIKNAKDYKIWTVCFNKIPIGIFGIKNIKNNEGEYWGYIGEKAYWGKGIGKWMVDESINFCKVISLSKLYLNVLKSNNRAIGLYKKKGFCIVSSDDKMIKMERIL